MLWLWLLIGAPATLHVESSSTATELLPLLVEELGPEVIAADRRGATLALAVGEQDNQLALELIAREGGVVLERRFGLENGRLPALRLAVLAIAEALAIEEPERRPGLDAPPADTAPPPLEAPRSPIEPSPWSWASVLGASKLGGGDPLFGLEVAVFAEIQRFAFGISGQVLGLGGPQATSGDAVALEGATTAWGLLARARWTPFELGGVEIGVALGAGIERLDLAVTPTIFEGPEDQAQEVGGWVFLGRAGLDAAGPIGDRLRWRGGLAAQVEGDLPIGLPAGFPSSAEPLHPGGFGVLATLGVELGLF